MVSSRPHKVDFLWKIHLMWEPHGSQASWGPSAPETTPDIKVPPYQQIEIWMMSLLTFFDQAKALSHQQSPFLHLLIAKGKDKFCLTSHLHSLEYEKQVLHVDTPVVCIDTDAQNFSNLSLINTTEIMSISLVTIESWAWYLCVSVKVNEACITLRQTLSMV